MNKTDIDPDSNTINLNIECIKGRDAHDLFCALKAFINTNQ